MNLKDLISEDNDNSPLQKIEVEKGFILSRAFAEHWPEIASTKLDYIKIEAIPSTNILRTQSFFGHYPFLPTGINYPVDYRGG